MPASPLKHPLHITAAFAEALARLDFLANNRRRLGMLLGESGSGKTLVLQQFAAARRRAGAEVAVASCLGLNLGELLSSVACGWGCGPAGSAAEFALWQRVSDRLVELQYEHVDCLLLLDDAHAARPELISAVERLAGGSAASEAGLTIVCAAEPEFVLNLGLRLLEMTDLRIELPAWEAAEVQSFIAARTNSGSSAPLDPAAVARLQELSRGMPRKVEQLMELASIAAAGREVDAETIDDVYEELSIAR